MENPISDQLVSFFLSALLGMMGGCLYDMLRLVWRKKSRLTHVLDGVYVVAVLLVIFLFALRRGQGELRLYMLLAMVLGAVLYFTAFSSLFYPLWSFWLDTAAEWCALLWKPVRILIRRGKIFSQFLKKHFHFCSKYATIKEYQWKCSLTEKRVRRKEAPPVAKGQKKKKNRVSGVVVAVLLLSGVVGMEIVHVYGQIDEARTQEAELAARLEEQKRVNAGLAEDLSRADDEEFIKELARDELGLAEQGERIFYDVND